MLVADPVYRVRSKTFDIAGVQQLRLSAPLARDDELRDGVVSIMILTDNRDWQARQRHQRDRQQPPVELSNT